MWTLIKAVLRFFKNSKLSLIGLLLLIFFSSTIFTVLNNTTLNLTTSYQTISRQGNLHDFVINENYTKGSGSYKWSKDNPKTSNLTVTFVSSDQNGTTLHFALDINSILTGSDAWTGAYAQVYQTYKDDPTFKTYLSFDKTFLVENKENNKKHPWENTTADTFLNESSNVKDIESFISQKQVSLDTFVEEKIREIYVNKLTNELGVSLREFNSINVSNNSQGMFFKVVESSSDYNIDNIVYYSGNQLSKKNDFSSLFTNFQSDTKTYSRLLSSYLARAKWTDNEYTTRFNELYSYVLTHPDFNPYTDTTVETTINEAITDLKSIVDNNQYNDKGYRLQFSLVKLNTIPVNGTLDDFSTYEVIISPEYLQKLNKSYYNYQDWLDHKSDSQEEFLQWFQSIPDTYKIKVDNNEFIILGTGISPDFMYPIVSFANLVPNPETEQVLYVNPSGYDRIYDSFRGSEQESFLVGKFDSKTTNKNSVIDKINTISKDFMSWPANINAAYLADDISNSLSPTALRLQFVPQIVTGMNTVSFFLTTFILLLSIFISIVIIQRFIQVNRNSLGIMQANGYKKKEIVFCLTLLIGLPVLFASIIGYVIGFLMQDLAIGLLGSFWTIPTKLSPFSIGMLFGVAFFVVLIFVFITIVFSVFALRGETSEFMKDEAKYKMTKIAHILKKPFGKFSIITRFRAAIAFSSIWRLILLSLMSTVLMVSLTFSLNIINRFKDSLEASYSPRQYTYSLNLATPTLQGGQYYAVPYNSQGKTLDKYTYFDTKEYPTTSSSNWLSQNYLDGKYGSSDYLQNTIFTDFVTKYGNYQLPSTDDNSGKDQDPLYLKNKTSSKQLINFSLGLGPLTTNPWNLAATMMPPNNSNYANQAYQSLFTKAIVDESKKVKLNSNSSEEKTYRDWILDFTEQVSYDDSTVSSGSAFIDEKESLKNGYNPDKTLANGYSEDDVAKNLKKAIYLNFDSSKIISSTLKSTLKSEFVSLMMYLFTDENYYENAYGINYNKLVINPTDEPYSYLTFNIESVNGRNKKSVDSLTATGIDSQTKRLVLKNESGEYINQKVDNPIETISAMDTNFNTTDYDVYPIIINSYAAKKYGLSINDVVKISVSNSADRYSRQYFGLDNPIAYVKVVDITSTYQGSEFFMNWYDTNKILGLSINNVSPSLPTSADQIKDVVDWSTAVDLDGNKKSIPERNEFIWNKSGFNGIFSTDKNTLVEVVSGISLYSPSGLYIGTDKIDPNNATTKSVFGYDNNLEVIAKITGLDIANMGVDTAIQTVANIFGTSSTFTILSSANSKDSTLNVINTISQTASSIQDVILAIVILISIIIVIIISSIIINDSIKLAAILKCLGLSDRLNAASFLSVYLPVFLIGLIVAIPLTSLLNFIYIQVIFNFANILLVIPGVWWYYVISSLEIILIFMVSLGTAWWKIKKMDLTKYIK